MIEPVRKSRFSREIVQINFGGYRVYQDLSLIPIETGAVRGSYLDMTSVCAPGRQATQRYSCPTTEGKQGWCRLLAETFADAKQQAEHFDAVLVAKSKGLTVA